MMKAAHTRNVERAGDMKLASKPVSFQAQSAPASAAIADPQSEAGRLVSQDIVAMMLGDLLIFSDGLEYPSPW